MARRTAAFGLFFALAATGPARAGDAVGDLYVQSTPAGATVLVDGRPTGLLTPVLLRDLPSGEHELRLDLGCQVAAQRVEVKPRVVSRAELVLALGTGALRVGSSPTGAVLTVDGVERGSTPVLLEGLACGSHRIELAALEHVPLSQQIELASGEERVLDLALAAIVYGTLVVVPSPLDAEVYLDGDLAGRGAMTLERLVAGAHDLELRASGLAAQHRSVTVPADDVVRVEVSLTPPLPSSVAPAEGEPPVHDRSRSVVLRRVLAGLLAGAGAGLCAHAGYVWGDTADAYAQYLDYERKNRAEAFYDEQVLPGRVVIAVDLGAAALLLGGGAALWFAPGRDGSGRKEDAR